MAGKTTLDVEAIDEPALTNTILDIDASDPVGKQLRDLERTDKTMLVCQASNTIDKAREDAQLYNYSEVEQALQALDWKMAADSDHMRVGLLFERLGRARLQRQGRRQCPGQN